MEEKIIAAVYLIIATSILVLNVFLIYLALKIHPRTKDVNFIIIISLLGIILPIAGWVGFIYNKIQNIRLTETIVGCQILGFITGFIFFSEILVNVLLAIERFSQIVKKDLLNYFYLPILLSSVSFFLLLFVSASENFMISTKSKLTCMIMPNNSMLSAITYYTFILVSISSLSIIFYCYLKLSSHTSNLTKFIELDSMHSEAKIELKRSWSIKWVQLRIYTTLIIYSISTLGSILGTLLESSVSFIHNVDPRLVYIISLLSMLFYLIGSLSNSILFLFLHTGVSNQFRNLFSALKSNSNLPSNITNN